MTWFGPHIFGNFKIPREKRKRKKSPVEKRPGKYPEYLKKIRALPCCVCGRPGPSEVHHLKGTGLRGTGMKSTDNYTVPLCHTHHIHGVELVGSRKEMQWFFARNIRPLTLAENLYASRHSLSAMEAVLAAHRVEGSP